METSKTNPINKPHTLQNVSGFSHEQPTICVTTTDPSWEEAFENWKAGKNPSSSPEWKKGVFLTFVPTSPTT